MIQLPDVTLIMIETMEHQLAKLAVEDSLHDVRFGDAIFFTDQNEPVPGCRMVHVPNWPTKLEWSQFSWFGVTPHVRTSHMLYVQWDSWVVDTVMWRDYFLDYDYVGAPWPWHPDKRVGNGGFSLRSTALMRYLRDHRDRFPCTTSIDDDLLCRSYRPALEDVGFTWAPERVAEEFAFECAKPSHASFGFHAMFNWPKVLTRERLYERLLIAQCSPYISKSDYLLNAFRTLNPDIIAELEQIGGHQRLCEQGDPGLAAGGRDADAAN
jgi:hypothetical protein